LEKKEKILVIKLCCIGDIIQLTPALRAIKGSGAEIHLLCNEWVKEITEMAPYIDHTHIVDVRNIFSVAGVITGLRKEKFDLVINFHRDLKSYLFVSALGIKKRAGFDWGAGGIFLTDKFRYDTKIHETERYMAITDGLGFKRDGNYTLIKRPYAGNVKIDFPAGRIKIGIFPAGGNNPGTIMPLKRWPAGNFNALIKMAEAAGMKAYVFGADFDRKTAEEAAAGTGAEIVINGLKDFAYCAAAMDVFIAGDTGPLHIASALGVRTIGLYGPTDPAVFGAKGQWVVNLFEKEGCSPCYEPATVFKRKFLKCRDNLCMKNITVEKVFETVKCLIK
jgi:ADP-heptose:LPS heptosyltransferase